MSVGRLVLVAGIAAGLVGGLGAEGVSGAPPLDDGRAAYLARPWAESATRDAAIDAYEVWVDGRRVPLHTADVDSSEWGNEYYFGSFAVERPTRVRIRAKKSLRDVRILPARWNLAVTPVGDREISFVVDRPMRLSVERAGRIRPLLLFADPPERDVPRPGDAGVVCRNPYNWVLSFLDCEDVTVENFKLCGGRMINDDAVDICNCRRFVLRNSFFRCVDDIFAIKGNLPFGAAMTPVEDIEISDCEAWTDGANVFRVGFECNASWFRGIRVRGIDVLHAAVNYRDVSEDWANCIFYLQPANDMTMEDLAFEEIRIRGEGPLALFSAYCHAWGCRCRPYQTAGSLRNVRLRNVSVEGDVKAQVLLRGHAADRGIEGVAFENVTVGGRRLRADSGEVVVGPFVRGIDFDCRTK